VGQNKKVLYFNYTGGPRFEKIRFEKISPYLLRFELFTKQIFFIKIIQKTFLTNEFLKQIVLINQIQRKSVLK